MAKLRTYNTTQGAYRASVKLALLWPRWGFTVMPDPRPGHWHWTIKAELKAEIGAIGARFTYVGTGPFAKVAGEAR